MYDSEDEPPARINRFGLIRTGENRSALIVVVGVLIGVLALAAVLGYVVFHALTSTDRTTVGLSGQEDREGPLGLAHSCAIAHSLADASHSRGALIAVRRTQALRGGTIAVTVIRGSI